MPDRKFLETYPLYRKFKINQTPPSLEFLDKPAIHMRCDVCKSDQTFNMTNEYYENRFINDPVSGSVLRAEYLCTSCSAFRRYFLLKFGVSEDYVMKVGQEPPWDISLDRNLEKLLGDHAEYYKKGLICESQGYGIGAFSYYRRITEEIIDQLLTEIADLIPSGDREAYNKALEQAKKTTVAQDKIELVKDLLPEILKPDNVNPLSILHDTLSRGLHSKPDEQCLELAGIVRDALVFLVNQVLERKAATSKFTKSMRKLLDQKKK